jgi:hypothetical protein
MHNVKELYKACCSGDRDKVIQLLDQRVDPNQAFVSNCPLFPVAGNGHLDIVRVLLDRNADPNFSNANNWTALHRACNQSQHQVVRELIERRAVVNTVTSYDSTPLHIAVQSKHEAIAMTLIEARADINLKNVYRSTTAVGTSPITLATDTLIDMHVIITIVVSMYCRRHTRHRSRCVHHRSLQLECSNKVHTPYANGLQHELTNQLVALDCLIGSNQGISISLLEPR